jgi:hypothetical protein
MADVVLRFIYYPHSDSVASFNSVYSFLKKAIRIILNGTHLGKIYSEWVLL